MHVRTSDLALTLSLHLCPSLSSVCTCVPLYVCVALHPPFYLTPISCVCAALQVIGMCMAQLLEQRHRQGSGSGSCRGDTSYF